MITTLKITTFLAALICVGLVGFVGAFGLKGDPDIEKFIAEPSFVDGLKKGNSTAKANSDEMSPLVREAQLFAKRINPPPPPRPPAPPKPAVSTRVRTAGPITPPHLRRLLLSLRSLNLSRCAGTRMTLTGQWL